MSIVTSGGILPEPDISDCERWGSANGTEGYPFARTIGGVSLFDFQNFEEEEYEREYPASNWRSFAPFNGERSSRVWIEIDRALVPSKFVSGEELIDRWKNDNAYHRKLMPHIEAAHLGKIPIFSFPRIVETNKCSISIYKNHGYYLNKMAYEIRDKQKSGA